MKTFWKDRSIRRINDLEIRQFERFERKVAITRNFLIFQKVRNKVNKLKIDRQTQRKVPAFLSHSSRVRVPPAFVPHSSRVRLAFLPTREECERNAGTFLCGCIHHINLVRIRDTFAVVRTPFDSYSWNGS